MMLAALQDARYRSRFVYILRSASAPDRHYVGRTADVDDRLAWHNEGPCADPGDPMCHVGLHSPPGPQPLALQSYLHNFARWTDARPSGPGLFRMLESRLVPDLQRRIISALLIK